MMLDAERLGPDRLLVPMRAEGPGGLVGDAMVEIGPDHELYAQWSQWLADREQRGSGRRTAELPPADPAGDRGGDSGAA